MSTIPKVDRLADAVAGELDTSQIKIFYDGESDTLLFYLMYVDLAISYEMSENLYLLLDPETEDVVGFQFDDYLDTMVVDHPKLLNLAHLTEISTEQIEDARRRIGEDRWRNSVIQQTVQELETAFR